MIGVALRLGRVSNLPTVWTNAMAGGLLAAGAAATPGGAALWGPILATALALTLFYVGGMWLNDAFDAEIDARERANRPIPKGEIGRGTVFAGGFAMLAAGLALAWPLGPGAVAAALLLGLSILAYDWLHKRTALAPLIMGPRASSATLAAAAVSGRSPGPALIGGLGLCAYVVGLTYAARAEAYDRLDNAWPLAVLAAPCLMACWQAFTTPLALPVALGLIVVVGLALRHLFRRAPGDVPKAVTLLIAGISLYDAAMMAGAGLVAMIVGVLGFALTRVPQRSVPGT